ncbi:lipopolysaccharide assembly LapA domain-containing protein [Rhodoferax sp. WC2427]|uniref:LapA family protein n=1 Tax=Rhodoferax sp. WC2427 TaxID=3234144 RepID=UPI003467E704
MKNLVRLLKWLLKAAIFFTLFAFALNNQQDAVVHFFFGTQWRAPMVLLILSAFAAGLALGILGMVPRWWKHRVVAKKAQQLPPPTATDTPRTEPIAPPHGL